MRREAPSTQQKPRLVLPIHDVRRQSVDSGRTSADALQRPRTRRVFEALISAIFGKGIVLLVNAASVPIAIRYLGAEMFGVWMTISTTLVLLLILDFGIANSVTNLISEAYARDDQQLASSYSAASFWMMVAVACLLGAIGLVFYPHVSWGGLFHLRDAQKGEVAAHAVAAAYIVFLLGLPAGLASKLLGGYQELRMANIFAAMGSLAGLAGLAIAVYLHGTISWLIAASSGAVVLVNYLCLGWIWMMHKPWLAPRPRHWNWNATRRLLAGGRDLFILQIAGLIVFNSDNFVIAHYLGPLEVTPYSVTWRLVGYAAALQIVITPALWPAYAEAYVRRDLAWIRRTLTLVMAATIGVVVCVCGILVLEGKAIIRMWAGPAAVPTESLIVAMGAWILISTFMANTSTVLLATNETKMQAQLSVLAAAVNLGLSIWWVQRIGSIGVILATIASYVLVLVIPQTLQVLKVLNVAPQKQPS